MKIRVGVVGATGYTGLELLRILRGHPDVDLCFAASRSHPGQSLAELFPSAVDIRLIAVDDAPYDKVDVVFSCLPHGVGAPRTASALEAGTRVIDLSADFRLKDPETYRRWYGHDHPAPQWLPASVYGLSECARGELKTARLVANPGCYPTSILLALGPVYQAGLGGDSIIADCKSGVSGAGREPRPETHFVEVANNFSPYKIGRSHRHLPEIEQLLAQWIDRAPKLLFSPHLLPVPRGILSTVYVPLRQPCDEADIRDLYARQYADEPFIRLLPKGHLATLAHVQYTNLCALALTVVDGSLIVTSAIDNLVKGAAGQAVQNMNLMFEREERSGLLRLQDVGRNE